MIVTASASFSFARLNRESRLGFRRRPPASFCVSRRCCSGKQQICPSLSLAGTLAEIESSGVMACLRAESGELAMEAAQAALTGGISVLEITMTTPDVFEVLHGLVQQHPDAILGVGTVLNSIDAQNAIKAGAKFLMSPATVKDILDDVQGSEILYIPGVMTPTEVLNAYEDGARIVKVYPVAALGGVKYFSALKKSFSHIPMVASQGMTIDSMRMYIDQGASSVVLSDAIFDKEAMSRRDYEQIHRLARLAAVHSKEGSNWKIKRMSSFTVAESSMSYR